jgi:hypothetical protein
MGLLSFLTTLPTSTDLASVLRPYFLGNKFKKRDHLGDLGLGGRINNANRNCKEIRSGDADEDGSVAAAVNTAMNSWSPKKVKNFLTI